MTIMTTHGHDVVGNVIPIPSTTSTTTSSSPPSSSSLSSMSSTTSTSASSISTATSILPSVATSSAASLSVSNDNNSDNECFLEAESDLSYEFPVEKLHSLEEKIDSYRWIVPIMPHEELCQLLKISIDMCKKGLDVTNEHCQRFYHHTLVKAFGKIITDDSLINWKPNIVQHIYRNCLLLIDLIILKLDDDGFICHDFLALILNPMSRFHIQNSAKNSETVKFEYNLTEEDLFARPSNDMHLPNGLLTDLINEFGVRDGFTKLFERFQNNSKSMPLPIVASLIGPFMNCSDYLTVHTITKYLIPILEMVPSIMLKISDDELKKDSKNENKIDTAADIIKMAKNLCFRVPDQQDLILTFDEVRLKMILRQLQISTFNGKMNALNEINKIIQNLQAYYPTRNLNSETFTAKFVAKWIDDNEVLEIVLKDSLHQPQYVDKLEKIVRFMLKEKMLSLPNLDALWEAQCGKHEAIVKNVHDLLAKLAWDFTGEQLDHLFECFKRSFTTANKKQQERLLELIRKLAEDDKHGVMANKVLKLFWNLAHSRDAPTDIVDQALCAHVKILDYNCSQDRDAQKGIWLEKCVHELNSGDDSWVILALKEIREIICVYDPNLSSSQSHRSTQALYPRYEIVTRLINQYDLVTLLINNFIKYMDHIRCLVKTRSEIDETYCHDGRFSHVKQVQERLSFIRFIQHESNSYLGIDHAKPIWQSLAENAIFTIDREMCFKWFSDLMNEDYDLAPKYRRSFFEEAILKLDPILLSETGLNCFQQFFRIVNTDERNLLFKKDCYYLENPDLVGIDYLWSVIISSSDAVALKAIEIMKEVHMYILHRTHNKVVQIHEQFIKDCLAQMNDHYKNIEMLLQSSPADYDTEVTDKMQQSAKKIYRVIQLLSEYIHDCDMNYNSDRKILPLHRAARGKLMVVYVRFPFQNRQADDYNFNTHSNETVAGLKRLIVRQLQLVNMKIDLCLGNDLIDVNDEHKMLTVLGITEKTILSGKVTPLNPHLASSPDSSSDESPQVSPKTSYVSGEAGCSNSNSNMNINDNIKLTMQNLAATTSMSNQNLNSTNSSLIHTVPHIDLESRLPGVLMSRSHSNFEFLWNLTIISNQINNQELKTACYDLLSLLPADVNVVNEIHQLISFEMILKHTHSPTQCIYYLQVLYSLLMPANVDLFDDKLVKFQVLFFNSSKVNFIEILNSNENLVFDHIDYDTKKRILLVTLKLSKLLFYVILATLKQLMLEDQLVLSATYALANQLSLGFCEKPESQTTVALLRYAWSSAFGVLHFDPIDWDDLHQLCSNSVSNTDEMMESEIDLCREALECFTAAAMLDLPTLIFIVREQYWKFFLQDILLLNNQSTIRITAIEQLLRLCTHDSTCLLNTITYLFALLDTVVPKKSSQSYEYFQIFCRLLSCTEPPLDDATELVDLLQTVIDWLRNIKSTSVDSILLEGHLCLARELIPNFENTNDFMLKDFATELLLDFIFPASKIKHIATKDVLSKDARFNIEPICNNGNVLNAAFELLLVIFCVDPDSYEHAVNLLLDLFYSDSEPVLTEWEYLPPIGLRSLDGFVGLKNAGATCYMNSVLQQLFMIKSIRKSILACDGAIGDNFEPQDVEEEPRNDDFDEKMLGDDSRKEYNIEILKQVQVIFGHLLCSRLQYFVPKGLWRYFRLQGEPVNLREQQDAVEFFMSLIDSVDEALKSLNHEQVMNKILGGLYSDQKICKDCPHRYSREEPFCVISVDIRNQNKLEDSLEQYVKGELLEGADAYYCDKCSCKVVTVKRLCVKKLPPVLAIQLKRFEYDFERLCAIKFNDYFEFPRHLDMEPYTVNGLAKIEGEVIDWDATISDECSKYKLTGIVVHSGQASGGHYYSYICNGDTSGAEKWYKFDDGEVTEFRMDDEELRVQCFGGDYMGGYFEPSMKRGSVRRQKRWWNAYMLFYTRVDSCDNTIEKMMQAVSIDGNQNGIDNEKDNDQMIKIPTAIERSILIQNIEFLHQRSQFNQEYFLFMQRLGIRFSPQNPDPIKDPLHHYAKCTMKLLAKFLFYTGFRTKKSLRGSTIDWYEILITYLGKSKAIAESFCSEIMSKSKQNILREYLLICPNDVRNVFIKIVVFVLQVLGTEHQQTRQVLDAVFVLLKNTIQESNQNIANYSQFFYSYAAINRESRKLLLDMNLAVFFIILTIEENLANNYGYQSIEFTKIHQIISILVRSCDTAHLSKSYNSQSRLSPLRNIYAEDSPAVMQLPSNVFELVFVQTAYVKRLIDDSTITEESAKLVQFCCWENPTFTQVILSEILWKITVSNFQDFRNLLEILATIMQVPDSWQLQRFIIVMRGLPDDREGLLDCILKNISHYQKKAYMTIKCIVQYALTHRELFSFLYNYEDMRDKWGEALKWLHDELNCNKSNRNLNYGGYNWSGNIQSNDTSSSHYLERSNSAKRILEKACELCPSDSDADDLSDRDKDNAFNENIENSERSDTSSSPPTSATIVHSSPNLN